MASRLEFTDVSKFDFEIDNSVSEKIQKQKEEILRFFQNRNNSDIPKNAPTIRASIEGNKVVFTLMEEVPID